MGSIWGRTFVAVLVAALLLAAARGHAYTPDSPKVQAMVAKGLEYLSSHEPGDFQKIGGLCLAGLCFVKAGQHEHPVVGAAIRRCKELTAQPPQMITTSVCDIYSSGLVIIFLSAVDGNAYRKEIAVMVRSLELRQLIGGAWTYESYTVGDTSMTQYGALGLWEASASGCPLPMDRVARALGWLMRTQDINGGWGYHPDDPGSYKLLEQREIRLSLVTAALGSIYLCSDLLEFAPGMVQPERELPAALKPVIAAGPRAARTRIDRAQLRQTLRNGTAWFNRTYQIDPEGYTHYYLYALERYQSLREVAEKRTVAEPTWYNQGVEYLARTQSDDGSWNSSSGPDVDTAFAVLFLLRSMKKSIQKSRNFGDGTLTGGRGLPSNSADAELKQGRVVSRRLAGPATGLLEILNDPNHPDILYLADNLDQVNPDQAGLNAAQRAELDRVVESGSPEARLIALRALARARDLDNVPRLIASLRDPDWRVVQEANAGLARMARRLGGFALPEQTDEAAREKAIARWKAWYRIARPEAEFADDPP
jgi:hypothetical protein